MQSKSIFASKTFWVNVAVAGLMLAEAKEVVNVLPTAAQVYIPAVVAGINILLRVSTVQPVLLPGRFAQYQSGYQG